MTILRQFRLFLLPLLGAFALSACGINSVPAAEEVAKAKWADVQAQYQRRANLTDNLVATVKAAGKLEQDTLVKVTEARSRATSVQVNATDLSDPAKVQQFQQAQAQLSQGIGRLIASVEAYPELKANENFKDLQSQLEGTENRIAVAVRDYNEAVRAYNTRIRTFPDAIGAKIIHGAKPMTPFQATTPGAEEAPKVDFGN
ncbi:LemA family protein [Sphingobium chlorophenolicum L-1]|uniref:LemA family protein n=1 Tax=Sphingobium chlorophenolicum L-1 TaxID=690566 RepID=F6EZL7_SPHCR|nr:LemA family protein [Sphingobium chlorophenolicum]AEG49347.1 LemA family protein [Sphingobium chlorophenolicum L-1]